MSGISMISNEAICMLGCLDFPRALQLCHRMGLKNGDATLFCVCE